MIPAAFIEMNALPLTLNGKVDRRALPAPGHDRPRQEKKYVGPRDSVEAELTAIWESILDVHPIGVEDKFFDLGGHSLLAVRLLARIEKKFDRKLPLAMVLQAPTIARMASFIRKGKAWRPVPPWSRFRPKVQSRRCFLCMELAGACSGVTQIWRQLRAGKPVYALKSRSMDAQDEFSRIEEIASQYVADVRAFQPRGPYHLGGYCSAGTWLMRWRGKPIRRARRWHC